MHIKYDFQLLADDVSRFNANRKITRETCPKDNTWFVDGGRCGWAHCCKWCEDNPKKDNEQKERGK